MICKKESQNAPPPEMLMRARIQGVHEDTSRTPPPPGGKCHPGIVHHRWRPLCRKTSRRYAMTRYTVPMTMIILFVRVSTVHNAQSTASSHGNSTRYSKKKREKKRKKKV